MNPQRQAVLSIFIILLVMVALFWPCMETPAVVMDEGILLVYPELLAQGKLPYQSFETFYAPGNLLALTGAYSIFGVTIETERALGFCYHLLLTAGIFVFARRWSLYLAFAAAVLAQFLMLPLQLVAFAWLGGITCLLWSLITLAGATAVWRIAGSGLLAGLALLYRQDLGPALIVASLPLWLQLKPRARWLYLGGLSIGLLPLVWITCLVGFRPVWENLFVLPVLIGSAARRIPIWTAPKFVLGLFWVHVAAVIIHLIAGWRAIRAEPGESRSRLLLSVALLGLGITHQTMQRLDIIHIAFVASCTVALLPVSIVSLVGAARQRPVAVSQQWLISGGVLLGLVALALEPHFYYIRYCRLNLTLRSVPVESRGRSIPLGNVGVVREIQALVHEMDRRTRPGERLFVGSRDLRRTPANDVIFYHLFPWLTPASYYVELNPLSANGPKSRLADDLQSADWLILNSLWDHWNEPNASSQFGSDLPNQVVRDQFVQRVQVGSFALYERKARAID